MQWMRDKPLSSVLAGSCFYLHWMIRLNSAGSEHQKVLLHPKRKINYTFISGTRKFVLQISFSLLRFKEENQQPPPCLFVCFFFTILPASPFFINVSFDLENTLNNRDSVSSHFQAPRSSSKYSATRRFWSLFSVFGNVGKHGLSCICRSNEAFRQAHITCPESLCWTVFIICETKTRFLL